MQIEMKLCGASSKQSERLKGISEKIKIHKTKNISSRLLGGEITDELCSLFFFLHFRFFFSDKHFFIVNSSKQTYQGRREKVF